MQSILNPIRPVPVFVVTKSFDIYYFKNTFVFMNRVVITGMGIYSCIGKNLQEVTASLKAGKSGIIFDPVRKEFGYRSALTGWVERPSLKGLLDRRSRIMLPEEGEYAYMATIEALKNAGIDESYIAEVQPGILYGNDSSAKAVIESTDLIREKRHHAGGVGSGFPNPEFYGDHEPFYYF
ncbi:beta-ketoacyl synthase N-terminal-like domain-containing protein [Niabella hibiscisoli]|uniref:beta-ketoacyl synthase N-terminal-like domain-containing protein n=1 Tax=Niabella hibiscisoli TaxID=1825928 RepID=UPI0021D41527|nr:beta-ketoacyl synthase N-terminal-like domain-containing protein [Niabella hibiscisoli]